jgi:hypothetical protein
MTLEQIVNTHPCPIIRGKIMENLRLPKTTLKAYRLSKILIHCISDWGKTKEGGKFWDAVYESVFDGKILAYSDLKHLDLSYVPEPALPPVMWRKIDKDKLCIEMVAAMHISEPNLVFTGTLELDDYDIVTIEITKGAWVSGFTHYIPLSDLINLPIE